jgi:hypothetical protein
MVKRARKLGVNSGKFLGLSIKKQTTTNRSYEICQQQNRHGYGDKMLLTANTFITKRNILGAL